MGEESRGRRDFVKIIRITSEECLEKARIYLGGVREAGKRGSEEKTAVDSGEIFLYNGHKCKQLPNTVLITTRRSGYEYL